MGESGWRSPMFYVVLSRRDKYQRTVQMLWTDLLIATHTQSKVRSMCTNMQTDSCICLVWEQVKHVCEHETRDKWYVCLLQNLCDLVCKSIISHRHLLSALYRQQYFRYRLHGGFCIFWQIIYFMCKSSGLLKNHCKRSRSTSLAISKWTIIHLFVRRHLAKMIANYAWCLYQVSVTAVKIIAFKINYRP